MRRRVSVLIPCHNYGHYVARAITSALSQDTTSYTLEVIVVDDGSTDNTKDVLSHLAKTDRRVRIIHQQQAGAPAARNRAFEESTGEFVCFLDADDWFLEGKLERQISRFLEAPATDMVFCFQKGAYEDGRIEDGPRYASPEMLDTHAFLWSFRGTTGNPLIRRTLSNRWEPFAVTLFGLRRPSYSGGSQ